MKVVDDWAYQNGLSRGEGFILKETAYSILHGMSMSPKWDVDPRNEEDMLNMVKAVYSSRTSD
tara:strand:+ start:2816 stop:3004 length:189 start_codon:yes stop_codon:yes gene_type:complete